MRISIRWWDRPLACLLMLFVSVPLGLAATDDLPSAPHPVAAAGVPSPAGETAQPVLAGNAIPDSSSFSSSLIAQAAQDQQPAPPPPPASSSSSSQQNAPQQPVGTAAAPYVRPSGVPASRPAGAAIAPAKQKRVRIYAIRIALLVGAAVAIGTVVAASEGSPSRP